MIFSSGAEMSTGQGTPVDGAAWTPLVTVALRSHNDVLYARRTLDILSRQTFRDFEVVSLDDHSNDGTAEILASYSFVRVADSVPTPYIPGRTLNYACSCSRGKYIVFLNLDAVPQSETYLERMLAPLASGSAELVYGNQICRPDASELVRKDYSRAFGDGRLAATWRHFFSMASSAVSRELLLNHPFNEELHYSEDIEWSYRLKRLGFRIAYAADAVVEHSHNYTLPQVRKRFFNEGIADRVIFGESQSFVTFLRQFCMESARDAVYLLKRRKFVSLFGILPYRFTQKFNYWRGTRAGTGIDK